MSSSNDRSHVTVKKKMADNASDVTVKKAKEPADDGSDVAVKKEKEPADDGSDVAVKKEMADHASHVTVEKEMADNASDVTDETEETDEGSDVTDEKETTCQDEKKWKACEACDDAVDRMFLQQYGESMKGPEEAGLRIGLLNANGMLNKLDMIKGLIHIHQFDIFVVVESKLLKGEEVNIGGYEKRFSHRPRGSRGGGLLVYWKEGVFEEEVNTFQEYEQNNYQLLLVTFTTPLKLCLVAAYKPPDRSKQGFVDWLKSHISERDAEELLILGDFNIDIISKNKFYSTNKKLVEDIESLGVSQMVTLPTRVTGSTSSLIDHVYISKTLLGGRKIKVLQTAISDHDVVYFTIPSKKPEHPTAMQTTDDQHWEKLLGTLDTTYSTKKVPADIMREALKKSKTVKCEAIKSRGSLERKWRDCAKARDLHTPVNCHSTVITDYEKVASFLQPPICRPKSSAETESSISTDEVNCALKWYLKSRHVEVGNLASDQDVDRHVQRLHADSSNSSFKWLAEKCRDHKTKSTYSEQDKISRLVDYITAARMVRKFDVKPQSHADVLNSLHQKLECAQVGNNCVVACFFNKEDWENLQKKHNWKDFEKCKYTKCLEDEEHSCLIWQSWLVIFGKQLSEEENVDSFSYGNELVVCITVGESHMPSSDLKNYLSSNMPDKTGVAIFAKDANKAAIEQEIKSKLNLQKNHLISHPIECFKIQLGGKNAKNTDSTRNEATLDQIFNICRVSLTFEKESETVFSAIEKFTSFKCKNPLKECKARDFYTRENLDAHHKDQHGVCQYCGKIYRDQGVYYDRHVIQCSETNAEDDE